MHGRVDAVTVLGTPARDAPRGVAARLRISDRQAAVASYESETFASASDFVRARAGTRPASQRAWFLDVRGAFALARLVLAEPALDVDLSTTSAGRRLRAAMRGRTFGLPRNRLCVAVFAVPEQVPDRPSGNRHRAVRAALNAAQRAGLVVRAVPDPAERLQLAAVAARHSPRLREWAESAADHPEDEWWAAEDARGELAGLTVVGVDIRWASLITLIGLGPSRHASTARFVLHHTLVGVLARRGVRHLAVLDDSPLLVDPGTRHLQRVLGYQLVRLRRPRSRQHL